MTSRNLGDRSVYPFPPANSGQMLYTGPDGVGDYRPRLYSNPAYIGIGAKSSEASNDVSYLFGPDFIEKPKRKHERIGEIGCDIRTLLNKLDDSQSDARLSSVELEHVIQNQNPQKPIVHGPFRRAVENNALFHKFQEPWYPDIPNTQLYLGWTANPTRSQQFTSQKKARDGSRVQSRGGNTSAVQSGVFGQGSIRSPETDSDKFK